MSKGNISHGEMYLTDNGDSNIYCVKFEIVNFSDEFRII